MALAAQAQVPFTGTRVRRRQNMCLLRMLLLLVLLRQVVVWLHSLGLPPAVVSAVRPSSGRMVDLLEPPPPLLFGPWSS